MRKRLARCCSALLVLGWSAGTLRAQEAESAVQLHGFVSQGFVKTTDNDFLGKSKRGSFEFTEVGLNVTKELGPKLRVGMQLFARNIGSIGNFQPQFDWFYVDYRFFDWLGLRAGRTKLPFGLFNEVNDIDSARVPVLLPQSVYPIQNRDYLLAQTGLELYGDLPLGPAGALEYRAYGGTILFDTLAAQSTVRDVSVAYLIGCRVMWSTPLRGLDLGGSVQALRLDFDYLPPAAAVAAAQSAGTVSDTFSGAVAATLPAVLWVGSLLYQTGDLLLASEYSRWRVGLNSNVPALLPELHAVSERAYAMVSYRVNDWFAPAAYYSLMFPNVEQRKNRENQQHDIALTTRFDLNENWLFKLEGHYMYGTAGLSRTENDVNSLHELPRAWGLFLAKTTAYF